MKLKSPMPYQHFVLTTGSSYASDRYGSITPLNAADEAALRAVGCVSAPWGDGDPFDEEAEPVRLTPAEARASRGEV